MQSEVLKESWGWLRASLISQGLLWLTLASIAAIPFFYVGMTDLWAAWQAPQYSHGPLIPLISGYLFLRQMKAVPEHPGPIQGRWLGLAVMAIALVIGIVGNLALVEKLVAFALIVWVFGMILVNFGWTRGLQFWPPVVHLAFMLPLPYWVHWQISLFLQGVSSEVGVWFVQLANIPVYLDGHIIDLGVYKLHVAEACSGLRYMFPIMSFTYIFAVLYQGSIWHKAILLLSAIPIAILMNSMRIGFIGIIVDNYGIEHAEGFMHFFEGWVVFLLCILAVTLLARVMQRLSSDRRSLVEVLDLDSTGIGTQLSRVRHIRPSGALATGAVAFLVAGLTVTPLTRPTPAELDRDPFLLFPREIGHWQGTRMPEIPREIAAILEADDYMNTIYEIPGNGPHAGVPVDMFIAWYRDLTQAAIHSPEVCLPAGGWEMSEIEERRITVEVAGQSVALPVNRAIIQKGLQKQLVYYWFEQSGRRLTSDLDAKFWLLWDGLDSGRQDGALVRFITSITPGETDAEAEARLQAMIGAVMPAMPRFISVAPFDPAPAD